ncbi:MAG: spore coat protein U domain-containing protein, partial [bacterium]|nr:spore coat protein U domain-containing protein [bacterium]
MKKLILAVSILTLVLGLSVNAKAATEKTTMDARCEIPEVVTVSATTLDFGTILSDSDTFATATITVKATNGTNYNIALDAGLHSDVSRTIRNDKDNAIPYYLYKDSGYTQEWGDSDYDNTYAYGTSSGP